MEIPIHMTEEEVVHIPKVVTQTRVRHQHVEQPLARMAGFLGGFQVEGAGAKMKDLKNHAAIVLGDSKRAIRYGLSGRASKGHCYKNLRQKSQVKHSFNGRTEG